MAVIEERMYGANDAVEQECLADAVKVAEANIVLAKDTLSRRHTELADARAALRRARGLSAHLARTLIQWHQEHGRNWTRALNPARTILIGEGYVELGDENGHPWRWRLTDEACRLAVTLATNHPELTT